MFPIWRDEHRQTAIDIFVDTLFPSGAEYPRAWVNALDGIDVRFVSLETLIQMKEVAGRD